MCKETYRPRNHASSDNDKNTASEFRLFKVTNTVQNCCNSEFIIYKYISLILPLSLTGYLENGLTHIAIPKLWLNK
jgi:hypothetical protein